MLYIVRGVPGSGKTTLAQTLGTGTYVEADMFMVDDNGDYSFDPSRLKECHQKCQQEVEKILARGDTVAVSNTFVKRWEMEPYFRVAEKHGHEVTVIRCEGNFPNVHGVPKSKVDSMKKNFETL